MAANCFSVELRKEDIEVSQTYMSSLFGMPVILIAIEPMYVCETRPSACLRMFVRPDPLPLVERGENNATLMTLIAVANALEFR